MSLKIKQLEPEPEISPNSAQISENRPSKEVIESKEEPQVVSEHVAVEEVSSSPAPCDPSVPQSNECDVLQATEQLSNSEGESNLAVTNSIEINSCSKTFKKRYSRLFTSAAPKPECIDANFFKPSIKLTPFYVGGGTYQVVKSKIGLENPEVSWSYSILSHGEFSHTWSLVPTVGMNIMNLQENTTPIHPIAELKTMGPGINYGEAHISDFQFRWEASSITMVHHYDSYSLDGTHTSFQVEGGSTFEWNMGKTPDISGMMPLNLWKETSANPPTRNLAAKLITEPFFTNPCGRGTLWCLEIDEDYADAHIVLLSAFAMKECHSKVAALFAKKQLSLSPALPLLNYAFQDDGRVLGSSGKFWGDWEDELRAARNSSTEPGTENHEDVTVIKVFNPSHLRKFALNQHIINRLNDEISRKVQDIKLYYSIQ